jgi:hypothetical protein
MGLAFGTRLHITIIILFPIGFLMGIPFSGGILWMRNISASPATTPLVWAVNGAASVIASVLAALLAISLGFLLVFQVGALCYAAAWIIVMAKEHHQPQRILHL